MALHISFNTSVTPIQMTVAADTATERSSQITAVSNGETATAVLPWPVQITDSSGHTWTQVSDDHQTAVFHY